MVQRASKVQKATQPVRTQLPRASHPLNASPQTKTPIATSKQKGKKGKGKAVDHETNASTTATRRDLAYGFTVEDIYFDEDHFSVSSAEDEGGVVDGKSASELRAAMIYSMEKVQASTKARRRDQRDWTHLAPGQTDLLETANDLYKTIDAQGGIVDDEEYWLSFPPHIRSFVRVGACYMIQSLTQIDPGPGYVRHCTTDDSDGCR
jgi:hypothetical protein